MYHLKKISHSKLCVIKKAIHYYIFSLQSITMTEEAKDQASIATDLYHSKIVKKINTRLPGNTHKITLVYHEARALKAAFIIFQQFCENALEHAIIDVYKQDLQKQIKNT